MNQRRTRFNCDWDISNQGKGYTRREKRFLKRAQQEGKSITYMAVKLRRGYWAIEVQIKGYGVVGSKKVHPMLSKKKKHPHPQAEHVNQHGKRFERKLRATLQRKRSFKKVGVQTGIKQCGQMNRLFQGKQELLKTEEQEVEKELKELLGL